jgi:hypothetical protein
MLEGSIQVAYPPFRHHSKPCTTEIGVGLALQKQGLYSRLWMISMPSARWTSREEPISLHLQQSGSTDPLLILCLPKAASTLPDKKEGEALDRHYVLAHRILKERGDPDITLYTDTRQIFVWGHQMVTIDEELEAAKQAQTVTSTLSISSAPDPNSVVALRKVKDVAAQAISIFPNEAPLNDARNKVVHAVFDLIRGQLTQEKIDNAKGAIGVWTLRLRPSGD